MATFIVTNNQNSGVGSLRWAIAQSNTNSGADTIEFEVNINTVDLTSAIDITDTVTLNGGGLVISQTGTDRIFNISDNSSETLIDVVFNNVTISGGRSEELGGAIFTLENLTINESVIKDNITSARGGGIYSEGAALTITDSLFEQNEVTGDSNVSSGGAFGIEDGTLNILNSVFRNNKSLIGVGAISGGESTISNSTFDSNDGSALLIADNNITSIEEVSLTNNSSQVNGAGIRVELGSEVSISKSLIGNNQSGSGAGVFVTDSIVEINESSIANNTASEAGGGISVDGTGEFTILSSTISENSAPFASALEVNGNDASAFVAGVNIIDNTGSENQLEGNVEFGGSNTGGILDLNSTDPEDPVDPVDSSLNLVDVNRFYQYERGFHFYTADINESQSIQAQSEAGELKYNYENVSYSALRDNLDSLTGETIEGAKPVYRFFNNDTGAHLYTMDENEKAYIEDTLSNYDLEGTAYYAFESEVQDLETIPVYRLLNAETGTHLFSADQNEVDYIQENLNNYSAEGNSGIAFYALEV